MVLDIIIAVVSTLLILTALVVAHEFGHYIMAKKRGIGVDEFAIGFGPKLLKWNWKGTEFSLRAILAGGLVRFPDDLDKDPQPGDLRAASISSRVLTILAGPAMNLILAIVLTVILLMTSGDAVPVIREVAPNSPAEQAGLMEGDLIKEYDGTNIDFAYDMQSASQKEKDDSLPLVIERDGEELVYDIPYEETDGQKLIGISFALEPVKFNFFEALGLSFKWIFIQMKEILSALGNLFFRGQGIENMAGIVGMSAMVGNAVQTGPDITLMLVILISVNLAIVNLLPIPALDGGKLVLYAVEKARKKPAPERVEGILNLAGFVLLIGLAAFLVVQDIGRLLPM